MMNFKGLAVVEGRLDMLENAEVLQATSSSFYISQDLVLTFSLTLHEGRKLGGREGGIVSPLIRRLVGIRSTRS